MKEFSELIADGMSSYYDWWTTKYSEKIYGFTFFSTSLLEYGGCTVFTEEGLEKALKEYQKDPYYATHPEEQLRNSLRWSSSDSIHHMINEDIFGELNERLEIESQQIYEMGEIELDRRITELYTAVIKGINEFRSRRIPKDNEDILVTMLWGDQSSEEISYFIQQCNSKCSAKKFISQFDG